MIIDRILILDRDSKFEMSIKALPNWEHSPDVTIQDAVLRTNRFKINLALNCLVGHLTLSTLVRNEHARHRT